MADLKNSENSKKLMIVVVISFSIFMLLFVGYQRGYFGGNQSPTTGVSDSGQLAALIESVGGELIPFATSEVSSVEAAPLTFDKDLKGSLVLVNFWASWCEPCVIETPDLIELAEKNPSLKILFVNEDSSRKDLEIFLKSFPGMISERTFVIWDTDKSLMKKMNVSLLPESHFFDREGNFIRVIKGSINWKNFKIE